jgi:hypothetical protein
MPAYGAKRPFVVRDELASECLGAPGGRRLGRWIKQYHLRHHFISEKHWLGVSNPSLDGVFGIFRGPAATEKSSTTRHL